MNGTATHTLVAFTAVLPLAPLAALDDADNGPFRTAKDAAVKYELK